MKSKWIRAEFGQHLDKILWRASWADPNAQQALVHQYFFEAADMEAAHAKILAWVNLPSHPLPLNARIRYEEWRSPDRAGRGLPIWRVTWQENQEKHMLFFFEPHDLEGAVRRAQSWSQYRAETLDHFETLSRLDGLQLSQAWFDPDEGKAIFAH